MLNRTHCRRLIGRRPVLAFGGGTVLAMAALLVAATPTLVKAQGGFGGVAPGSNGAASQARRQAEERAFERSEDKRREQRRSFQGGESLTTEPLAAVRFTGNDTIPDHAIRSLIGSQAGRPAYQAQVREDVRKLFEKRWFDSVVPVIRVADEGPILVFEVREKPIVGRVEFRGNTKIKTKKLQAECGLVAGRSPYDVAANRQCARRIERLYKDKGYREVSVQLVTGGNPDERDVIFEIAEGPKIAVDGFRFQGNQFVSSSVLKTRLETKRRWFWLIGGTYDPETLRDDEAALEQYYQNLGFFDVDIKAEAMRRPDSGSLTVNYTISEGPRYSVNNIRFEGNTVYADGDLRAPLVLTTGKPFLARELREDVEKLKDMYDDLGRPFAKVNLVREYPAPGQVDLVYRMDEDRVRYIGRININFRGEDPHTRETHILNIVSRDLVPGQIARAKDIKRATERVRGSQISERADPATVNFRPVEGDLYLAPAIARGQSVIAQPRPQQPAVPGVMPRVGHSIGPAPRPLRQVGSQFIPSHPTSPVLRELNESTEGFYEWLRVPEVPQFQFQTPEPAESSGGAGDNATVVRGQSFGPTFNDPNASFRSQSNGFVRSQSIDPYGQPVPQNFLPGGSPQGDPFGSVGARPPGFIDIDIDVTEARTGRFMFGAGVNSDAGVVGQIVLEENNFDLFKPPRSLADFRNGRAFRGGGQSFRLEAAPGAEVSRYLASWNDPYFLNTDYSFGVQGFYYTRFFQDWTEERLGGRVTLGRILSQNWSASTSIRLEQVQVRDVVNAPGTNEAPQDLIDVLGDNFLSTARVNIAYDTRDSSFIPTKGFLAEFAYEQAFGDFNYPRFDINASRYWTVFQRPDGYGKHTLRFSGRLGFTGGDTPVFERYFAGGFQTLRGFEFRGVSPEATGGGATPVPRRVGGEFLSTGTLEYMFPITADDNFKGVVFTDFGTVAENVSLDELRIAAGFGLRVNVPAMGPAPLAFDFAFPIASEDFDDERVFSFYIGLTR